MGNKEKKTGSLGSKVSLIVVCSVLLSTLAIGIFCYYSYRDNSIQLTGEKALAAAQSIASGIDGE